jgi:hypothetical protein
MADIISYAISIVANTQSPTAADVAAATAAWGRYEDHILIISHAVTGIAALLGGGAIASLGVGLFHAFKQAQSMATGLAMFAAGKTMAVASGKAAAAKAAAEGVTKESKMEAASAAKAEQDDDRTTMHGIRGAGVNAATIQNMFKDGNVDIFKGNGYYGQKINATTGRTDTLNPSNFFHPDMQNMDFVAVNAKSGRVDYQKFGDLANRVRNDGGEFAIVGKNGITAKFERTGDHFYETTAGHDSKTNPGLTSNELHKRFFSP